MDAPPSINRWPPRRRARARRRSVLQVAGVAGAGLLLLLVTAGVDLYTELLWFESLGYASVFLTVLSFQSTLFLLGALTFALLFLANVALARRLAQRYHERVGGEEGIWAFIEGVVSRLGAEASYARAVNLSVLGIGLLLAVLVGLVLAGQWDAALRFAAAEPFGRADPIYGQDVGFYVFQLPFYRVVLSWLLGVVALGGICTLGVYAVVLGYELNASLERVAANPGRGIRLHLAAFVAALLVLLGVNHLLERFELVYSTRGAAYGASYTDVVLLGPALWVMTGAALLAAGLVLAAGLRAQLRLAAVGLGLWGGVALLGGVIGPAVFETLVVRPNQLERERPFIENSIRMTRAAFGLEEVQEQFFPAEDTVAPEAVRASPETIRNIRLWDHRPLRDALNQLQSIRSYYTFHDVDVDRYVINGEYRQVMVGARELSVDALPPQSRTWVNQHLQFTHGYGVSMVFVNAVAEEGKPQFVVQDVPPVGAIPIARPELYYGERTSAYVIVKTSEPEFDYERGDQSVTTRYQGRGINLGSPLRRLAFALKLRDLNLLVTGQLRPESELLYRRLVAERVQRVAPFLMLDGDPYIVVADGRLVWVLDGYTVSNGYPYAQPQLWTAGQRRTINYLRNSVKATVDAYDGTVRLYVADPGDPIIRAYQRGFPGLLRPLDELPAAVRVHLRYPQDLFTIQAAVYRTYHLTDPTALYNRVDIWAIPEEKFYERRQPVEPYYVIMRLPGEPREEFLLMQPFTPVGRDNMIAWLAARSDEPHYGRLLVYRYPKERFINGPFNIEARIDQDPAISAQFTLWSQAGSRVIRGNLLAIPIGNANLYVEPIYLQAEDRPIPELKRVIVASGNRVVMEPTLEEALAKLFGPAATAAGPGPTVPGPAAMAPTGAVPADVAELVRSARQHYERAQEALRAGDWARYGEEQRALEADLRRLSDLVGR